MYSLMAIVEHFLCRIFNLKPTKGLVLPSAHQLCVVKCLPTAIKTYKYSQKLHLNAVEKNDLVRKSPLPIVIYLSLSLSLSLCVCVCVCLMLICHI